MNGKAYYLDLQTLLDYLSVHGETCILSTALKDRNRMGYVVVRDGAMTTCYIAEGERIVLQGKQAHKILGQYSEWYVQLQYEPRAALPPSASPPNFSPSKSPSQPLPPIKSGSLSPSLRPDFPGEQSPAPRPGTPSGQLPTPRPGTPSGQLPTPRPGTPSGQGSAIYPGSQSVQRPVQRSSAPLRWFPVIKRELSPEEFMALPARQRMVIRLVLTMVNGRRNIEEIKAQLQLSPGTVEGVLEYLRALNVIE